MRRVAGVTAPPTTRRVGQSRTALARHGNARCSSSEPPTPRTLVPGACVTVHPSLTDRRPASRPPQHRPGTSNPVSPPPRLRPSSLITLAGWLRAPIRTPTSRGEATLSRAKGDVPRKWPVTEPRARPPILNPRRTRPSFLLSHQGVAAVGLGTLDFPFYFFSFFLFSSLLLRSSCHACGNNRICGYTGNPGTLYRFTSGSLTV